MLIIYIIKLWINYIVLKQEGLKRQKSFSRSIGGLQGSLYRAIIDFSILRYKAYISLNAIIKTIYRMKISHKHLLEWTTAEEAERKAKNSVKDYYFDMWTNVLFGVLMILISPYISSAFFLGIIWIIAPAIVSYISKE